MKILLVENDPATAGKIENMLKKDDISVEISSTVKEAITYLKLNNDISIILSEISFPGLDGYDLLKFKKSEARLKKIPAIIMSAAYDQSSVLNCVSMGALDYIVKPFSEQTFLSKIEKARRHIFKSVLLVDDDEITLRLLQKTLARDGYNSIVSSDGKSAIKLLSDQKDNIGMIISDIEMPEMNGFELLEEVKQDYPEIPIIMITGKNEKTAKEKAIETGADGFIARPFNNTDIIDLVNSVMTQNK